MKLAEALILRAEKQRRIEQLKNRVIENARIQEGDQVSENPEELLKSIDENLEELLILIKRINNTNNKTEYEENISLSEALAKRDIIIKKRSILAQISDEASIKNNRYSNSEIKYISTIDVSEIQNQIGNLSEEWRKLDTEIQRLNWNTDLI